MGFTIHSFENKTSIGQELRSARQKRAVSLDEVSATTKIQKKYLIAIEENRWHDLPEPIYTRNFLKAYVQFLGKDPTYVLSRFKQERGCCDYTEGYKTPRQRVRRSRLMVTPRIFKLCVVCVLAIAVLSYLGFQIRSIVQPPTLFVETPKDGLTTNHPIISVSGKIEGEATVFVNKERVLPFANGTFTTEITLERGLNIITVEGEKRYSNPATLYRTVIFDPIADEQ